VVLDAILERIPAPKIPPELEEKGVNTPEKMKKAETRALIFDSNYDPYRGVVSYVRVMQGTLKRGDNAYFLSNEKKIDITEVGCFKPEYSPTKKIQSGEVGYVVTGLKKVSEARVGDTLWKAGSDNKDIKKSMRLPGYKQVVPFVFASIFTVDADDYKILRDSLEKLSLNDSSLSYEAERPVYNQEVSYFS